MKNMKKAVSFLLAFAMVFAMNFTTAFAAEAPESAVTPVATSSSEDDGIMPLVWNQIHADIPANSSLTLSGYTFPDRYMAFEAHANVMGGGTFNGTYTVTLLDHGATKSSMTNDINGIDYKNDWIDFKSTNNTNCGFKIVNHSNIDITVYITYYSWS